MVGGLSANWLGKIYKNGAKGLLPVRVEQLDQRLAEAHELMWVAVVNEPRRLNTIRKWEIALMPHVNINTISIWDC